MKGEQRLRLEELEAAVARGNYDARPARQQRRPGHLGAGCQPAGVLRLLVPTHREQTILQPRVPAPRMI